MSVEFTPLSGGEGGAKTTRNEEVMSDGRGGCEQEGLLHIQHLQTKILTRYAKS
ncbi:MAG: hypothetical protein LBO09_04450 [Candidatus Peribacteria bacterium]|nr:hypothetical protein [Candidatus Peribacteria bacterium]